MVDNTLDSGKTTVWMESAFMYGQMAEYSKDNTETIKRKATVSIYGLTAGNTLDGG
jgi:hypothetical protein